LVTGTEEAEEKNPENGGSRFLNNVGNLIWEYMVLQPRRPESTKYKWTFNPCHGIYEQKNAVLLFR
jgi:hypothetical protein